MFLVVATLAKFERRLIIERTMAVLDVARACGDTSKRLGLPAEKVAAIQAVATWWLRAQVQAERGVPAMQALVNEFIAVRLTS